MHMKKNIIYIVLLLVILTSCQRKEIIRTHGISYLEKREKLAIINKSNKNDVVKFLGQPASKGMTDNNMWIYIERTHTKGKLLKLGRSELSKNNTLILEFNNYGILINKKFYNINDMNKVEFAETITENDVKKQNFIRSFLSSVRSKMENKRK
jgi:outer membrane protein assembly factor BamE (lipoprotein component of BamABCDE complex)